MDIYYSAPPHIMAYVIMTKKKVMILGGSEKKKTWEGLEKVKRRDKVI